MPCLFGQRRSVSDEGHANPSSPAWRVVCRARLRARSPRGLNRAGTRERGQAGSGRWNHRSARVREDIDTTSRDRDARGSCPPRPWGQVESEAARRGHARRVGWGGAARSLRVVGKRVVAVFRMERGLGGGRVGFRHRFERTRGHRGWMCAGKASRGVVCFARVGPAYMDAYLEAGSFTKCGPPHD
jgi:hypothetical protein